MQVFVNISSKVAFILKSYVRQPSQVYQNFHGVPFLQRSQLLPGTGSNKLQFLHSARCVTLPMRDQILDAQPGESFPSTLPMVWGPVDEANHCPSPRPCIHRNCYMPKLKVDLSPYKMAIP